MGVTKQIITPGDGTTKPSQGDHIGMQYTGWLQNKDGSKGNQFDSSVNRPGDFNISIGTGQVIRGWDEGILSADGGMSLGEKATLTITGDYAYGPGGFSTIIPPNATLIFDVQLVSINGKRAPGL